MPELLFMLIGSVLVNVLTVRGQLNPGVRGPGAAGYAGATALVASTLPSALAATAIVQALHTLILRPLDVGYLYLLVLVAASAAATWATQQLFRLATKSPASEASALVAANSLVIVAMADIAGSDRGVAAVLMFASIFALGFAILLLAMTELAARLDDVAAPGPLKGAPLLFVTAGIAALALLGLGGLLPG